MNNKHVRLEKSIYLTPKGRFVVPYNVWVSGARTSSTRTFDTLQEAKNYARQRKAERVKPMRYIRIVGKKYAVEGASIGLPYKTFSTLDDAVKYRNAAPKLQVKREAPDNPLWGVWN